MYVDSDIGKMMKNEEANILFVVLFTLQAVQAPFLS